MPAPTARARVRQELTAEIKAAARAELASSGAGSLSLRAVARRLEMVPSALYRYFAGRDALLTALVIDAYGSMAAAATEADARAGPAPAARWVAVGHAVRDWAQAHRGEWALVYGSPVPGYAAPPDTIEPGTAVARLLGRIVVDAHPDGHAGGLPLRPAITPDLRRWVDTVRAVVAAEVGDELAVVAVAAWVCLIGTVSLELFGQFGPEASPADAFFEAGLQLSVGLLALGEGS